MLTDPAPDDRPVDGENQASLTIMRDAMLDPDHDVVAAVFIGGKRGLAQEWAIFRDRFPSAPRYPIAAPGGFSAELAGSFLDGSFGLRRQLATSRDYGSIADAILADIVGPEIPTTDQPAWSDGLRQRLLEAMESPLIHPGSAELAQLAVERLPDPDAVVTGFAQKVAQTIADGQRHDASRYRRRAVWPCGHGCGRAVAPRCFRSGVGRYLNDLYGQANWLVGKGLALTGLLEIDV